MISTLKKMASGALVLSMSMSMLTSGAVAQTKTK